MGNHRDIWVFVEIKKGEIRGVTFELLGKAKELAENTDDRICAVVIDKDSSRFHEDLSYHKVDKIYTCENEILGDYLTETFSSILIDMIKQYTPNIVLFPATKIGRDLAPRVAGALETGLTTDCIDLRIQDGLLVRTRSVYGGNYLVDIICPDKKPQIA
ncbi:MAG: electron transfer flavoprotein subunit alpha/FixB family protein, partial [Candidatus Thorarchaeota archaeon]